MAVTWPPVEVRKVWVEAAPPADGFDTAPEPLRHAYQPAGRHELVGAGMWLTTLCSLRAVAVTPTPGRPAPECPACDRAWRAAEGIEQRDAHHTMPPARRGR
jgi:zinc finger protein